MSEVSEPDGETEAAVEVTLVPKRGGTSVIWNWFGFKSSDTEQTSVICKVCRRVVTARGGNTSNLFHHLKNTHAREYEEATRAKTSASGTSSTSGARPKTTQLSLQASFTAATPYDKSSKKWKDITRAIALYIAKDMVPIQTIERDGFRHVVHTLDSRYELPGRKFFSQKCLPELYTEVRDRVMNEIRHLEAYSATTDLWSSRTTEPYISLTIHFIDDDWKLRSRCLQTAFFPEDHTGAIIALGLKDALSAWGLDEARLVCMTTDSGANMVRALEINKWTRLACFGHRLHNAIERSVQHDARVARATGMCKKVVSTFSYSWKKKNALTSAQRELNLPPHKLITESPTRWGSRVKMMERVLEQEKAITQVLAADQKSRHLLPTWQDIDVLEAITKALKPLQDFTDALSGEEYVSVSYVKPVLHLLNTNILKPEEDKAGLCEDIKKRVLDYLNEKYKDPATDELLTMATFLDPRFKTTYMSPEKLEEVRSRVATETKALEEKTATGASSTEDQSERETSTAPVQLKKPKHSLGSFFKKCSSAPPKQQGIDMELDGYLLMVTADSDSDPLEWWRLQCSHFPRISRLAKKYLCIPATSSPSERAFSTGGNIVTSSRASLKPENVDRLVFLAKNLNV
ncbi:E3 SUMO-protein ligase ZBED1 [Labeo rohita]|uniref:E3 SUMO-protein ligase ZBED1 n=1 Tax=Labeo rohita TaxID=84645 RepID=A0ABQ8MGK9_LABRO|nr:E3 SUMO-protein ligase ZBED1 [Labeo rohita]